MAGTAVLVIHPGALGDVVLGFSALERLSQRFEAVDLLCQEQIGRAAMRLRLVRRSFPIESARFADLYGGFSPWLSSWIAGYGQVLLFSVSATLSDQLQRHTGCPVVRIPPRPGKNRRRHTADHLLAHLARCGLADPARPAVFRDLRAPDADPARVLLHPGAGSPKKRWPAERFFELADRLAAAGSDPQFILGPAEQDLAPAVKERPWPLFTTESLTDLLGRLLRAGALVGNDSGVSHLAAYVGLPTVAVFGPTDPAIWSPRGRAVAVVASRKSGSGPAAPDDAPPSVSAVFESLAGLLPRLTGSGAGR
jgi:ADP-heptose:LPS heptosyltransferase